MTFQTSPLDPYASAIQLWLNEDNTLTEIVDLMMATFNVGTSEASVRRCIERHNLSRPEKNRAESVEISGDTAIYEGDAQLGDIEDLLSDRGLDPEDWTVDYVKVNKWGSKDAPLDQLKVSLRRRRSVEFVYPAQDVEIITPGLEVPLSYDPHQPELVLILGDEQEPYSDPQLADVTVQWIEDNWPQRAVHVGDLMELPTVGKYADNPEWAASAQACVQSGYEKLKRYRKASPNTRWDLIIGNHENRLRNYLLLRAEKLFGVRPADNGEEQLDPFSVRNLLHLDELGINYVAPAGGYQFAQVPLGDELAVRHGWLVGANSAKSSLERLGHSILVGHTHHQRMHFRTMFDVYGGHRQLQAVEIGTMAGIKGGLGYAVDPDWQQGFATATVWPDGSYVIDLAKYENGVLLWRDQKYQA